MPRHEIPGFNPQQYSASECSIPGYVSPTERPQRTVTNQYGGTTIIEGGVPPDEVKEVLFEAIHRNATEPIPKRELYRKVFEETHIHPDDIDYMIWMMADPEGDSKYDDTLRHTGSWSIVQSRPIAEQTTARAPQTQRYWGG